MVVGGRGAGFGAGFRSVRFANVRRWVSQIAYGRRRTGFGLWAGFRSGTVHDDCEGLGGREFCLGLSPRCASVGRRARRRTVFGLGAGFRSVREWWAVVV